MKIAIFAALCLLALGVFWQYDPANHRLEPDPSYMLYAGQQILRGKPPYVGVTIVKTPLTAILSAGAIAPGRGIGLNDIFAARAGFMVLGALLVGVVYLFGASLWTRWAGVFTALALIGSEMLGSTLAEGPAPKVLFVLFGVMALWLTRRRHYLWAGAAGALSFLSWQPGLLFVAAALLGAVLEAIHPDSESRVGISSGIVRFKPVAVTLLGAVIPIALVALYLAFGDALAAGIRQTLFANTSYLDTVTTRRSVFQTMATNAGRIVRLAPRCLSDESGLLALRVLGVIGFSAAALWAWLRKKDSQPLRRTAPLWLAMSGIVGFTLLDLQSCPDFMPFVPFVALGTGWLVWQVVTFVKNIFGSKRTTLPARSQALPLIAAGVLVAYVVYGLLSSMGEPRTPDLAAQQELANNISRYLAPGDQLQQFGDAVTLILLERENATRFIHLGQKQGEGVLRAEGLSEQALIEQLTQAHPRVITLSRTKDETWAKPLYEFIRARYQLAESYDAASGGTLQVTDVYVLK